MEVLRPLIGMDKDEIVGQAERLGTFPDLDHSRSGLLPAVHAAPSGDARRPVDEIEAAERALPIGRYGGRQPSRRPRVGGLPIPGARIFGLRNEHSEDIMSRHDAK